MSSASFVVGDKVTVVLPDERDGIGSLLKYDRGEYVISKIVRSKGGYCELEGVKSDLGVPFSFLPEWLVKL